MEKDPRVNISVLILCYTEAMNPVRSPIDIQSRCFIIMRVISINF